MTNNEILKIAMAQSAVDLSADPKDFEKNENTVVISQKNEAARRYLKLPFSCQIVSYGSGVVASVSEEFFEITEKYINSYPTEHLFETPHMHALNEELLKKGQKICFMAEYFLPDLEVLRPLDCKYETRILTKEDFAELAEYLKEASFDRLYLQPMLFNPLIFCMIKKVNFFPYIRQPATIVSSYGTGSYHCIFEFSHFPKSSFN
jgi:hypothetical protein